METFFQDVRYAARRLLKSPGFAAVAILTLALGIGANTVVFSLADAFLLRPLPFAEPERLVHIWEANPREGNDAVRASLPNVQDWRAATNAFQDLALFNYTEENLTGIGDPERIPVGRVSANAFGVLGVQPVLGRGFLPGEDQPGEGAVVVLSHDFWWTRYGGDAGVLGATVRINDREHQVIGVMPPGFAFPLPITQIWAPYALDPAEHDRDNRRFQVVGRLAPGASIEQAQRELERVTRTLQAQYPETNRGWTARVIPLRDALNFASDVLPPMLLLLGVTGGMILLLVCANMAGLLLTRATARAREIAVRVALGASRGRLIRQLLTESMVLGLLGGAAGAALALAALRAIAAIIPPDLYRVGPIAVNARGALFTVGLSLLTAVLFGLGPAARAVRSSVAGRLREGGRTLSETAGSRRLQSGMVVAQIGLALALLMAATLTLQSLHRLRQVDLGFRPEGVLTVKLTLPRERYAEEADIVAFHRRVLDAARSRPGVEQAAIVQYLPLNHETSSQRFRVLGTASAASESPPDAVSLFVSPSYFEAMGIPLRRGRGFSDQDGPGTPRVVVVNEALARTYWPGGDAVGREIRLLEDGDEIAATVVGVVGNSRHSGLEQTAEPQIFVPQAQDPWRYMRLVVRTRGRPELLVAGVREAVGNVDPELPLSEIRPLASVVGEFLLPQRGLSGMLLVLGWGALTLAAVGIYGVMSYQVIARTREIGIRMALGADPRQVLRLVLRQGVLLAALGLALGLMGAFALARLLSSLLTGMGSGDPLTYAGVALLLGGVALLASYLPARRATQVDPVIALRAE